MGRSVSELSWRFLERVDCRPEQQRQLLLLRDDLFTCVSGMLAGGH